MPPATSGRSCCACSRPIPGSRWRALQADGSAGRLVTDLYPGLSAAFGGRRLDPVGQAGLAGSDVVFVAVPQGRSQEIVAPLIGEVPCVVDLGADFRLKDAALYEQWYGFTHAAPELLERAVYGLPELCRRELVGAELVAAPGCYVTAASLALAPLVAGGLVEPRGIVVDGASGTSGAGRALSEATHHAAANESYSAYKVAAHRHTPEMEQVIGASICFTPHLVPMTRGILATCYARAIGPCSTESLLDLLAATYKGEPFVSVVEEPPATRDVLGTNCARLSARFDARTGTAVVLGAIDNLTKGGAGQALQAANVALGLPEDAGLPQVALTP